MDCLTNGDHVWNKKELVYAIAKDDRLLRPANYPGTARTGSRRLTRRRARSP